MGKRALLLGLLLVVLLAALRWSQGRREPFHVSGFLEADEIRVGSRVGGRVARVQFEEGTRVPQGAALVELEPFDLLEKQAELEAHVARARAELERRRAGFRAEEVAQARARVQALTARLERLRAGARPQEIAAARARLDAARAAEALAGQEDARTRSLVEDAIRSKDALDRSRAGLESAQADVRARGEELNLLVEGSRKEDVDEAQAALAEAEAVLALREKGERAEDVLVAEAELAAAEAALRGAQRALDELTIRAPSEAVLEACDLQPGDLVAAGAPVALLRDTGELFVRAYVPQDRLTFGVDARLWVTVDAWPARRFAARVTFVAPEAEFTPSNVQTPEERSDVVLRVRLRLEEGLDVLRPGVAADLWLEE